MGQEQLLQRKRILGLDQPEHEKDAGFLGTQFVGNDESEAVVVDLHIALDAAGAGSRSADNNHSGANSRRGGRERGTRQVSVAYPGKHQPARARPDRGFHKIGARAHISV